MMCRTNDMIDRKYKLLTADLSQVICGRSLLDELAASSSSAGFSDGDKEVQAVVTDQKRSDAYTANTSLYNRRDSAVTMTKDGSTLDESNASSLTEDSATDSIDMAGRRQRRPAAMSTFPNQDNLKWDIPHTFSVPARQSALSRSGPTIRRRSQPLHKCPSMNQAISSIMKPSRYSSACKVGDSEATTKPSQLDTSLPSTAASSSSSSSHTSANRWIASGVVFSSSVEVYFFRI